MYVQIADDLKPHPIVISVLNKLARVIPTWKIIPTNDIIDVAFKDPVKRAEVFPRSSYNIFQQNKKLVCNISQHNR